MKKFTALLLCLLSAFSIFAFTACYNNDDEEQETPVRTTVTEEEWQKLFGVIDAETVKELSLFNFTVNYRYLEVYGDGRRERTDVMIFDYAKKAMSQTETEIYKYNDGEQKERNEVELYYWEGSDGTFYLYQDYGDSISTSTSDDIDFYNDVYAYYLNLYIALDCKHYIEDIADYYAKFTYNEELGEYYYETTDLSRGGETDIFRFEFADGKLVKTSLEFSHNGVIGRLMSQEYSYEGTVTVPDEVRKEFDQEE